MISYTMGILGEVHQCINLQCGSSTALLCNNIHQYCYLAAMKVAILLIQQEAHTPLEVFKTKLTDGEGVQNYK